MDIKEIQDLTRSGKYVFSDHAEEMMEKRSIDIFEVEEAVLNGKIIEDYPEDKFHPSCLIYGKTNKGRHLHVQFSLKPKIVTVYEPDSKKWIDYRIRRR